MQTAFIDESARAGQYLLAAAFLPTADLARATKAVREALPRGRKRTHLSSEGDQLRRQIIRAYVALEIPTSVVVVEHLRGDDHPARERCLQALLPVFDQRRVRMVVLDSRGESRDHLDRSFLAGAQRTGRAHAELVYAHRGSRNEPLLWLPDAFAWAYGAGGTWRPMVADVVTPILP